MNQDKGIVTNAEGNVVGEVSLADLSRMETADLKPTPITQNRENRRKLEQDKKRLRKKENKVVKTMVNKHEDNLEKLNEPATLKDVLEIANSIAQDTINEYHKQANPVIVGLSLHMELLKKLLIDKGFIDEPTFEALFEESVKEFNEQRELRLKSGQSEADATSADESSTPQEDLSPASGELQDQDGVKTEE